MAGLDQGLINEVLDRGLKITPEAVLRIWRIDNSRQISSIHTDILWVERGYQHANGDGVSWEYMMTHTNEFANLGIIGTSLPELVEALTSVGLFLGKQGSKLKTRPAHEEPRVILSVEFYEKTVIAAITVRQSRQMGSS
jgi:hypothetical protein